MWQLFSIIEKNPRSREVTVGVNLKQICLQSNLRSVILIELQLYYQMNRQRPYRPEARSAFREEDQFYPANSGRTDLTLLEEQNAILKLKCGKVSELQEKVDMVLKQNALLLSENEKMSRLLHQQKSQNDILRNKIESMSMQKVGFVSEFQMERKKMLMELERVGDDMAELELQKNNQINEMKNAYQIEIQALKRQIHNSEAASEAEIRKYREQIDKRQQELSDYINKLKRITTETDYEILRLKEDKEKLRAEIEYGEADHAKEIDSLRNRLQNNYLQELQALKRAHVKALDEAEKENIRLKTGLQDRGREIDQLSNKFNKQRAALEDNITYITRENEALRNKIIQTEKIAQYEIGNMKEHLNDLHESEIEQLLAKQQNQIRILQDEINRLQGIIHEKNIQIEQLIKDKVTNRNIFDSEISRIKDDYAAMINKCKEQEIKLADVSSQAAAKVSQRDRHIDYLQDVLKDQKTSFDSQQAALQKSLQVLKQDLHAERMATREKEQEHKEAISNLKHQLQQSKLNAQQKATELQKIINELKSQLNGTSTNLSTRVENLLAQIRALEKENEALKNNINLKEKEIKSINERLKASGERESRLEAEIDDLRSKLIKRQQKSNQSINEQKSRLSSSYTLALESLKADHEAALRLQANKIRDLQEKLRKKELQLEQLLKMYKKMTEEVQTITQQQAHKKDITLKFPGATADLIASKNLFDVYLKTKVLDVCGDALKQNYKNV